MIVLKIAGWLFLSLILLTFLLLLIPFSYQGSVRWDQLKKEIRGQVSWCFGLLQVNYHRMHAAPPAAIMRLAGIPVNLSGKEAFFQAREDKQKIKPAQQTASEKDQQIKRWNRSFTVREVLSRDLGLSITTLLRRLWLSLKPSRCMIRLRVGLDDPYKTAVLNHWLLILSPVWPRTQLVVEPVFHESVVEGGGDLKGELIPIAVLWTILRFIVSKPVRSIWLSLIHNNWYVKRRRRKYVI